MVRHLEKFRSLTLESTLIFYNPLKSQLKPPESTQYLLRSGKESSIFFWNGNITLHPPPKKKKIPTLLTSANITFNLTMLTKLAILALFMTSNILYYFHVHVEHSLQLNRWLNFDLDLCFSILI